MSSLFKNISGTRFALIELSMLLPIFIYAGLFWQEGLPLLSLLLYLLIVTLIFPLIYLRYQFFVIGMVSSESISILAQLNDIKSNLKDQLIKGAAGFFILAILMATLIWSSLKYFDIWKIQNVNIQWLPGIEIIIISIVLIILVPFLEEIFWRCFIQTALVGGLVYDYPPEFICWYIAFHYGAMYTFVFAAFLSQFWIAVCFSLVFVLVGRLMTSLRDKGILTAVLAHTGLNAGFVIILNIWFWEKLKL